MKVAAIQHDIVWEDAAATRPTSPRSSPRPRHPARGWSRSPRCSRPGSRCTPSASPRTKAAPSETFLLEQAREHDIHLVASIAQRGADGQYRNNAVLAESGR